MEKFQNSDILYMFDRLREPIYYPKGRRSDTVLFNVNREFLDKPYFDEATALLNRFGSEKGRRINIAQNFNSTIKNKCDQANITAVNRREVFSIFIPKHSQCAGRLLTLFMEAKNGQELMAIAAYCRDRVNPQLFTYSLSSALMHRKDTRNFRLPNFAELFPDSFIDPRFLNIARERVNILSNGLTQPIEIPIDFTGRDSDPEHQLAYWREDVGVNLHHWHWHLVYPFEGPEAIVNKDRRGELFYFMHRQIMARYNVERLSNNMSTVARLLDWNDPIPEAYFPKLTETVAGRAWPGRPAGLRLQNINRADQDLNFDIEDLRRFFNRIFDAINRQRITTTTGEEVRLDPVKGIDHLGNVVEASTLSLNPTFYGNAHNLGHLALGFIADPRNDHLESTGVIATSATAMRDPIFYRWHAYVDDVFQEHKNMLTPYTIQQLLFPGIAVAEAYVLSEKRNNRPAVQRNNLFTYYMLSDLNLTRGLDFTPRADVLARVTHLNHDSFEYFFSINNTTGSVRSGTFRVFMCPVLGFGGYTMPLNEMRNLMIEMDRFVADLPPGTSLVRRKSTEAATTIPYDQTFRNLDDRPMDLEAADNYNYCGCGWPQHMLVPRGTKSGLDCVLFVMVTDYRQDQVVKDPHGEDICRTGVTFCGLRDSLYPDSKPMNFPFDRRPRTGVSRLREFLTPNMSMTQVKIFHVPERRLGRVVPVESIKITDVDRTSTPPTTAIDTSTTTTAGNQNRPGNTPPVPRQ